jgi:hypothetical protein
VSAKSVTASSQSEQVTHETGRVDAKPVRVPSQPWRPLVEGLSSNAKGGRVGVEEVSGKVTTVHPRLTALPTKNEPLQRSSQTVPAKNQEGRKCPRLRTLRTLLGHFEDRDWPGRVMGRSAVASRGRAGRAGVN